MIKKLIFIIVLMLIPVTVYADEPQSIIKQELDRMDFSNLQKSIGNIEKGNYSDIYQSFDFKETAKSLATGKFTWNIKDLFNSLLKLFFRELLSTYGLIVKLIIIALLGALIYNLQNSFSKEGVGEAAFYACFCLIASVGIKVFISAAAELKVTLDNTIFFMNSLIPVLLTLLAAGGRTVSATALHPALFGAIGVITVIIKSFIIPLIYIMTAVRITDILAKDMSLGKLGNLFNTLIKWTMGTILAIFIGSVSLFGIIAPSLDQIALKTTKFAVGNMVPVVGGMLSDSMELVLGCAAILKQSIGITGLVAIILICAYPAIRMMAQSAMIHITAAIVEPISDKRISDLIDCIGKSISLILGMLITIMIMTFIVIAIVISIGG